MSNMKKITDTVLIFGRSPFLNKVDVKALLGLGYTTFGINNQEFETDYVSFVDECIAEMHETLPGTIITQSRHKVRQPAIFYDYYQGDFTHDFLLKWLHGRCSEAILIGCADFCGNKHYNTEIEFNPAEECIKRSIKFIEGIKDIKICKMNPDGVLNVPVKLYEDNFMVHPDLTRP